MKLSTILFIIVITGLCAALGFYINGWVAAGMWVGFMVGALLGSNNALAVRAAKDDAKAQAERLKARYHNDIP